ncbi:MULTISPECIES: DUF6644 family protein [Sphingomonas]|jgi:hypothetical protein|uniref:DUF6644 family protein n=1 Tax=Sphingomonas TaxID=13687 RepID=UPI001AE95E6A
MIHGLFQWLGQTGLGVFMRESTWAFAIVETIHLLGLAVLGGVVLVVNLTAGRVLFRRNDGAAIIAAARPAWLASLAVMLLSGGLLVASKPIRYYLDGTFRTKIALLALAIVASFLVQHIATQPRQSPALIRTLAVLALLLWLGVGVCGRIIGFL